MRRLCLGERACRPLGEIQFQQRQVEQPLARIVDDIDVQPPRAERALQERGRAVLDGDAQLADAPRALGPLRRVGGQRGQVLLVGEPWQGIVGLRLEVGAGDAPLGHGREVGQAPAGHEATHQGGDEDRLAGACQPGDAEAQGRCHQVADVGASALDGVCRNVAQVREPQDDRPSTASAWVAKTWKRRRQGSRRRAYSGSPPKSVVLQAGSWPRSSPQMPFASAAVVRGPASRR